MNYCLDFYSILPAFFILIIAICAMAISLVMLMRHKFFQNRHTYSYTGSSGNAVIKDFKVNLGDL